METEFILTFEQGQEFYRANITPFESKDKMIGFCLGLGAGMIKGKLVKVSMCVYNAEKWNNEPKWFHECNGKLWQEELEVK